MNAPRSSSSRAMARSANPATPSPEPWKLVPIESTELEPVLHALRERIKELNCLYGIARLAEESAGSLDAVLTGTVRLLPPAWQYPETARASIVYGERTYASHNGDSPPRWRQTASILLSGQPVGEVTVGYVEERPPAFEGPFLREERSLIDGVAEHLGTIAGRLRAEAELQQANRMLTVERESLREANIALKTVLARIGEEKEESRRDLHANVEKILLPVLNAMAMELPPSKRAYADLLRRHLLDLTEPLTRHVASALRTLTPSELAIGNMIRGGLRTKDIARLRGISPATVARHREHIRRRLGLVHSRANLTAFLQG